MASRRSIGGLLVVAVLLLAGVACRSAQLRAVARFNYQAKLVQVACLDVNGDGSVNASDADAAALPDMTGDGGVVNESDLSLVRQVDVSLPEGRPKDCKDGRASNPDWQVSKPQELDCAAGELGVIIVAIGGGAVDLATLDKAAGVRWMVEQLSDKLGLPAQVASVAPGLAGTSQPQSDTERWLAVFLEQRLREQPCVKVVLLGHSHGGVTATATAARLEEAGLGQQVLLTVLIDRATYAYFGDKDSIPQGSPVFNAYIPAPGQEIAGAVIDQPNVENFDAAALKAPERGEDGGAMKPVNHSTIDNSPELLREIEKRVVALAGTG